MNDSGSRPARFDSTTVVAVPSVEPAGQYNQAFHVMVTADITPGAGAHLLEIEQTAGVLAGLIIDRVSIEAQ